MNSENTYEYANQRYKTPRDAAAYWVAEIDNATDREEDWRADAKDAAEEYDSETSTNAADRNAFNILYSNVETLVPALYSSTPAPDCRPRNGRQDELARRAGTLLEECIAFQVDNQDFDEKITDAIYSHQIAGRGVLRVRYNPIMSEVAYMDGQTGEEVAFEETNIECVSWDKFLVGTATNWETVPWVAFKHAMTRDELLELVWDEEDPEASEALADAVPLDEDTGIDKDGEAKGVFSRACVWEIWDRDSRTVIYLAPYYRESLLAVIDDPLQLRNFFPCPRPLQAKRQGMDKMTPLCP